MGEDSFLEVDDRDTNDKTNLVSDSYYAILGAEEDDEGEMHIKVKDALGQAYWEGQKGQESTIWDDNTI